jgi:thiamine pyrophosphate-dependent acetolactate synthase large subunit-like protein
MHSVGCRCPVECQMKTTAADILIDTISDWGVEVVFGLPGDGINGIMEALRKRADKIRFIQVRHEEAAAFMACAYAKYTGKLGVCLATSGPGGIHLLNGLYDAKLDGQPVLAIRGFNTTTSSTLTASRISSWTNFSSMSRHTTHALWVLTTSRMLRIWLADSTCLSMRITPDNSS